MNIQPFILPAIIFCAVSGGASLIAVTYGALMYDMRETARLRKLKQYPQSRANRQRPLITVIISTENNEPEIERCLASIFRNNYRNVEILIVDQNSEDRTIYLVQRQIAAHPNHRIRLVARRSNQDKTSALFSAFNRHGHGQLVVALPGTCTLKFTALRTIAQRFTAEPGWDVCTFNEQFIANFSVAGLFAAYRSLLWRRAEKSLSTTGLLNKFGEAACFRAESFRTLPAQPRVIFADDVIIDLPAETSLHSVLTKTDTDLQRSLHANKSGFLRIIRIMLETATKVIQFTNVLLQPLLATYLLHLALFLHEPALLLALLGILSAALLIAIREASQLSAARKVAYGLGIPLTFGLFYAASFGRMLTAIAILPARSMSYIQNLRRAG